jgi:hypothetical protein
VTATVPVTRASAILASVSSAQTPAAKARTIVPLIRDRVRKLAHLDQVSIHLLARREGVIL